MGHRPDTFAQIELSTFLQNLRACLASKGTVYYNKIQGAVKCSNNDLSKLELIIYLASRYNSTHSLDCIFTGRPFPGFVWGEWTPGEDLAITDDNTYLQDFLDFAEKFCRDCIVTSDPAVAPTPEGDIYLKGENNDFILLEDNTTKITL
jgi:hypothetical protein